MRSRGFRFGLIGAVIGLIMVGPAAATVHVAAGERALRMAYESQEGDEGGFGGTFVEQCRAEGDVVVRCVITEGHGSTSLDTGNSRSSYVPKDFGLAHFLPDGRIVTTRQPFSEPVVALGSGISVPSRMRRTKLGRLAIKVSPDVDARVALSGRFGVKKIESGRVRERTVQVPGGETTVIALDLTTRQRKRISEALRRKSGSIKGQIDVTVSGDVGPADARDVLRKYVRVVR